MNFIEINKFSELHDGHKIFFCKTDFLYEDFKKISSIHNDVILITGNSDYPITDNIVNNAPKNIKKWFAQNAISNSKLIEPLPIGLENKLYSLRDGHGIGYYDRVKEKEELLSRSNQKNIEGFIYSNFNILTNYNERIKYKNLSIELDYIDWEENNLTLHDYFNKILKYKMVLCPIGNGIDTHRLWEVLYSNITPITVKTGNYNIYNLYEKLPIIILNHVDELRNFKLIEERYLLIKEKKYNMDYLNYDFWKKKIIELC